MKLNIAEIGVEVVINGQSQNFPLAYYMRGNKPAVDAALIKSKIEQIPLSIWAREMYCRSGEDAKNFMMAISLWGLNPERYGWNVEYSTNNGTRLIRPYVLPMHINDVLTSNIQSIVDDYYRFYR